MAERDEPAPEQLSSGDPARTRWALWLSAAVVVATVVGLALVHTADSGHRSPEPLAAPTPNAPPVAVARVSAGSVFVEPLPACTRTDHRRTLTVAFAVTNLNRSPLRLLSAESLPDALVGDLVAVRVGAGPCAGRERSLPQRLASAAQAVVALDFRLGAGCPRDAALRTRVSFRSGGTFAQADSSGVVDLRNVAFDTC
jgi:hypothetical protein